MINLNTRISVRCNCGQEFKNPYLRVESREGVASYTYSIFVGPCEYCINKAKQKVNLVDRDE